MLTSFQQQLLKGVISDTALPLGTTDNGKSWATKALHPSDAELPAGGIPDNKALPSAILHFNARYKVTAPSTLSTPTWNADILLGADPVCFGRVFTASSASAEPLINPTTLSGEEVTYSNFMINTQLAGTEDPEDPRTTYRDKMAEFRQNVRLYRMNYLGATLTHDAPALSNQGLVVGTQYPFTESEYGSSWDWVASPRQVVLGRKTQVWDPTFPTFDQLQNMPGVYSGRSADGLYMPLKMSEIDLEWKSTKDVSYEHVAAQYYGTPPEFYPVDNQICATATGSPTTATATNECHPLCPVLDVRGDATGVLLIDDKMLPRASWNIGHIAVRGLAPAASLYITVRAGIEVVVAPGSVYSPLVTKPVPKDQVAVDAYFAICRMLADAHPEQYNSAGTLLKVIASVASEVIPKLLPVLKAGYGAIKEIWSGRQEEKAQAVAKQQNQLRDPDREVVRKSDLAELKRALQAASSNSSRPRKSRGSKPRRK